MFQGRYKAVVVNGEEREGCYFKIVADCIHLNPARPGWAGGMTGKRLRSWRWSSFSACAGGKKPEWLETERVLRAFRLSEDHRGGRAYAGYLEARAKDAKGAVTDQVLKELRRGWCLGEKSFADKVLAALSGGTRPKRRRGNVAGAAASAHDEAVRIVLAALRALNAPTGAAQLSGKGKWVDETPVVAALIRKRTGVRNRWVAERLGMGHEGNVPRAIRRVNENPAWKPTREIRRQRKLGKLSRRAKFCITLDVISRVHPINRLCRHLFSITVARGRRGDLQ